MAHHLARQRDEFSRGLAVDGDDCHLAFLALRSDVHDGQDRLDLLLLFFGRRYQQAVVGVVSNHGWLGLVFKTPIGHALINQAVEAGECGLQSGIAQRENMQGPLQGSGFLGSEVADDFLNPSQVFSGGGNTEATGVRLGHDLGVGGSARAAVGHLAAVDLLNKRNDAFGFGYTA